MLNTVLTLLTVKAKTVVLVAGTAVVTAGAVGGGSVAVRAVTSESPAVRVAGATPTVGLVQPGDGPSARRGGTPATAGNPGPAAPGKPPVCNPSLSHGQNVAAYARSLPKGPDHGALVAGFARTGCGKKAGASDGSDPRTAEPATPAKTSKTARAANAARATRAAKAARAAQAAEAAKAARVAERATARAAAKAAAAKAAASAKAAGAGTAKAAGAGTAKAADARGASRPSRGAGGARAPRTAGADPNGKPAGGQPKR